MLQRTISECGAVDEVERLIADNVARATRRRSPTRRSVARARGELGALAKAVTAPVELTAGSASAWAMRRTSALRPARRAAIGVVPRLSSSSSSQSSASASLKPGVGEHVGRAVEFGQRGVVAQEERGHLQHPVDARCQQVAVVDESTNAARGLPEQLNEVGNGQPGRSGRRRSREQPARRTGDSGSGVPHAVTTGFRPESADSRRGR